MSLNSFALLDIDSPNPEHSKRNPSSLNLEILEDGFHQENEFEGIVGQSAALREVSAARRNSRKREFNCPLAGRDRHRKRTCRACNSQSQQAKGPRHS